MAYQAPLNWLQFWGAPILMFAVSFAYFFAADRSAGVPMRIAWSAHGAAAALIYMGAMAVWIGGLSRRSLEPIFLWSQFLPLGLIIYSLVRFRGKKIVHLLQVPNVLAMLLSVFVGSMAITGDWL
jgi:hypothetical protein